MALRLGTWWDLYWSILSVYDDRLGYSWLRFNDTSYEMAFSLGRGHGGVLGLDISLVLGGCNKRRLYGDYRAV